MVAKQKEKINPENLAPRLKAKYNDEVIPEMMKEFKFSNKLMVPKILKTTINVG